MCRTQAYCAVVARSYRLTRYSFCLWQSSAHRAMKHCISMCQSSTPVLEHCVFWCAPVRMLYNAYFCLRWSDTVKVHLSSTVSGGKFSPLAYFSIHSIGIYTCLFSWWFQISEKYNQLTHLLCPYRPWSIGSQVINRWYVLTFRHQASSI